MGTGVNNGKKKSKWWKMNDITAIILTKNEEMNIQRCIRSIERVADRIIVVDSGSTDNTCEIAERAGAEVVFHEFVTHGQQFNWALSEMNIQTQWILRLDADEVVTEELGKEIIAACNKHSNDNVNGLVIRFKVFFLGKFLKHGGMYPFLKLVVFKNKTAYIDEQGMRDHAVLTQGKLEYLKCDCLHYDFKNMESWINKHNWYSSIEAMNIAAECAQQGEAGKRTKLAEVTRVFRDKLYYKLPKYLRAKLYYWYRYYIKMGFLDGEAGRIHAFLQAYWYRYLVDVKLYEIEVNESNSSKECQ